jgi:hypothetical protein
METKPTIIDEHGQVLNAHPADTPGVVETILPYFPDDGRMSRYLAYVSSGFTRAEALKRVDASFEEREEWREVDEFRFLDDCGYGSLRDNTANAYMELMIRRDTVMVLELNQKMIEIVSKKIDEGQELSKDEKFIYDRASKIYTPENIQKMTNLVKNRPDDSNDSGKTTTFDFVAIVKGQVSR